nr:immunoglobulin light chain junction region [Macaca mulatta]MOV34367.1 immunoglobulin light chain junction region [Macaca mulatta]MOV34408.1 immunoglobulin light chain junction region [Macaca mulatta]MOV36996.1 immunoglobulin light chain junction region [Macaca mulatta]MOV37011.1 immunoglobulin light chain junction region [Macaca mulatta]
CQQYNNSPLTF